MILVALAELCISHSEVDRPYESEECKSNKRLIDDGGEGGAGASAREFR